MKKIISSVLILCVCCLVGCEKPQEKPKDGDQVGSMGQRKPLKSW
jgi:hypothetical protein